MTDSCLVVDGVSLQIRTSYHREPLPISIMFKAKSRLKCGENKDPPKGSYGKALKRRKYAITHTKAWSLNLAGSIADLAIFTDSDREVNVTIRSPSVYTSFD